MDHTDHLDAVDRETSALVAAATGETATLIPHLGSWTMHDLIAHTGRVWTIAAANVAAAKAEPTPPGDAGEAPDGDAAIEWLSERRTELLRVLGAAEPASVAWTFAGMHDAAWWTRRMAHETAVHRWDADAGLGKAIPLDSDLARDGVDEYTEVGLRFSSSRPNRAYPAETLHLHRTDGPGEWMLARGASEHEVVVTEEHGKGDAAVRGPASSLVLWIWGRPVDDVEIFGDPAVAAAWQSLAP